MALFQGDIDATIGSEEIVLRRLIHFGLTFIAIFQVTRHWTVKRILLR